MSLPHVQSAGGARLGNGGAKNGVFHMPYLEPLGAGSTSLSVSLSLSIKSHSLQGISSHKFLHGGPRFQEGASIWVLIANFPLAKRTKCN